MRYPEIRFHNKEQYGLNFEVPKNYKELVKKIDEDFIRGTQNSAKLVLKEFEVHCEFPQFQWDKERGLHAIHIGEGRGAYLGCGENLEEDEGYIFKNIDESWQALAVFNIISLYLNRLQEYKK